MTVSTVQLSPSVVLAILQPWTGVAETIHERIARLAEPDRSSEALWVGCGSGRSVLWWAERFHMRVTGVDPDPAAIESAEDAMRATGLSDLVTFQTGSAEDLPHETDMFDLTIIYLPALANVDGARALEQAARVARPMSVMVAVVPTWLQSPSEDAAAQIGALGIRPRVLMEWKQLMGAAGFVELTVEDAALDGGWIAHGLVELLLRGWRAARWKGVRAVLGGPLRALRLLTRTRVLGLSIVRGVRWPHG